MTNLLEWLATQEPADLWAALVFAACAYAILRLVLIIRGPR